MFDIKDYETMVKLELTAEERAILTRHCDALIESFTQLDGIDTKGAEPLVTVLELQNILREDAVVKLLPRDELLLNAPEQYDGYFQVPGTL